MPFLPRRDFDPGAASAEFTQQWKFPSDVFSVLLILGGDVVARALAQLAGSRATPVAFSFGWVAYALTAVAGAIGENKLMPPADCPCKVINGRNGFVRDNQSWVIGRVVRDFESWMDEAVRVRREELVDARWRELKADAERRRRQQQQRKAKERPKGAGDSAPPPEPAPPPPERPLRAGLCVSVYRAREARPGHPGYDRPYFTGFLTCVVQLGLAAIPCGISGDWGILLVTASGIALSLASGALPQWAREKWACRRGSRKTVVLTRGNGAQHAVVVIGAGRGLDLEDLAAAPTADDAGALPEAARTRLAVVGLAALWILLLITAAGIQNDTWFLLAVGGVGILQNVYAAGATRAPADFGMPLDFVEVLGEPKVMTTLFRVEERYPRLGRSMLATFFPAELSEAERARWAEYERIAKEKEAEEEASGQSSS